jgi:SAM-dependent methyltransferase
MPISQKVWNAALPEETDFWRKWFETKGLVWPESYAWRVDPNYEFYPSLRPYVNLPKDSTVKVLDVGAGPLTVLGKVWPGYKLDITAVDPLAHEYDKLIEEFKVTPLVRTKYGHGENLLDLFPESSFDLVYAENCLDHSYDPLLCLSQMLAVVKPGCYVATDHLVREGENEKYAGLHQWNFDVKGIFHKRFVIWRPGANPIDVQEYFGAKAKVSAKLIKRQVYAYLQKS